MSRRSGASLAGAALQGTLLMVTVDRVEADEVVVEWAEGTLSSLPVQLLPPGVQEGDRIRLRWRRTRPRGPLPARSHRPAPGLPIPDDFFVEATHGALSPPSSQAPECAHQEPAC